MKIAILVYGLSIGGAEILTLRLALSLRKHGHDIHILALGNTGNLEPVLKEQSIPYYYFGEMRGRSRKVVKEIFIAVKRENYDLLISNHFRQLIHSLPVTIFCNIPHIHIEHDNHLYNKKGKYRFVLRLAQNFLKAIVVISPTLEQWYKKNIPLRDNKIRAIANGVDTEIFTPAPEQKDALRRNLHIPEDAIVLGTCARLEPEKNITGLLDIFENYRKFNDKSFLLIVGGGSQAEILKKQAHDKGLNDHILFAGPQHNVVPWLQAMDFFLLTSLHEGLPLAVLEAMSCGTVVMANAVGDIPRLFNKNTGKTCSISDLISWQKELEELTLNKTSYNKISKNAREQIVSMYSFQACTRKYLELINECTQ